MIIDTHCHVIATDTKTYPLAPLYGRQSVWSATFPLDHPDLIGMARNVLFFLSPSDQDQIFFKTAQTL